jgi:hypothetical protein
MNLVVSDEREVLETAFEQMGRGTATGFDVVTGYDIKRVPARRGVENDDLRLVAGRQSWLEPWFEHAEYSVHPRVDRLLPRQDRGPADAQDVPIAALVGVTVRTDAKHPHGGRGGKFHRESDPELTVHFRKHTPNAQIDKILCAIRLADLYRRAIF